MRTPFLFVGNNQYQIEGLRLGRRARLDGGRLFALSCAARHGRELPKLFALALIGRAGEQHTLESFSTCELQVDTPQGGPLQVALDGEVVVLTRRCAIGSAHWRST